MHLLGWDNKLYMMHGTYIKKKFLASRNSDNLSLILHLFGSLSLILKRIFLLIY